MNPLFNMANKVHPGEPSSSSSVSYFSSNQETFTIWMKSLILNGKGCTVFDSNGRIVFRVDNYNCKSRDVFLMDCKGEILFAILKKKKFRLLRFWEGHRSKNTDQLNPKGPGFQVSKRFGISRGHSACEVVEVGVNKNQCLCYNIERCTRSSPWKIADKFGRPIAEIKRKQLTSGVLLGDDVLTMVVEPFIDHSLIMGLFVVYSLINCRM
ncbi:protein LURP-one-related 11-like [Humulus lupulus]|uniref:protein LURP-one-related 11-like n=1 Tax=Humulus lupulus TaxID=3486 RepID=UPI002B415FF3|nr:protein LURP-one-related 11-like [Humulus lupulus]